MGWNYLFTQLFHKPFVLVSSWIEKSSAKSTNSFAEILLSYNFSMPNSTLHQEPTQEPYKPLLISKPSTSSHIAKRFKLKNVNLT